MTEDKKRPYDAYGNTVEDYDKKIDRIVDELIEMKNRRKSLKFRILTEGIR